MSHLPFALMLVLLAAADPTAERIAAALEDFAGRCRAGAAQLWGISLCGEVLVADFEAGRLYASNPDPAGSLAAIGVLYAGPLPAALPRANTGVEWQGRRWTQVLWPLPEDPGERMRLLLHESFHRIQPELGLVGEEIKNPHLDEVRGRAWMRLELRALRAALVREDWRAAFADALTFRRHRYRLIHSARAGEWALERNEGLAEYTGVRLAYPAGTGAAHATAVLADADGWEHLGRRFAYASGPAWGLLLDRIAPQWRGEVLDGADFLQIATQAMPQSAVPDEDPVRRRALAYGLAEIEAEEAATARLREAERTRLRALLLSSDALALPLSEAQMSFDPRAVSALPPEGTVYGSLTLSDLWGRIEVSGPALISTDFTTLRVSRPTQSAEHGLVGEDWRLDLNPDWDYLDGRIVPRPTAN